MKNNLYVTEMQPNGTRTLIITDEYGQIKEYIEDAVFGGQYSATDKLGGAYGLINGDSVGYFDYSHEATDYDHETKQEIILDEYFVDLMIEHGEYQGVELVYKTNSKKIFDTIAISPVNDGNKVEDILIKYGFKNIA